MKTSSEVDLRVHIVLDREEAEWLRALLQNNPFPTEEATADAERRKELYDNLSNILGVHRGHQDKAR